MGTPQEYTIGANAMIVAANVQIDSLVSQLPFFEQAAARSFYASHINAIAGAGAKACIDAVDAYRASLQAHALNMHQVLSKK